MPELKLSSKILLGGGLLMVVLASARHLHQDSNFPTSRKETPQTARASAQPGMSPMIEKPVDTTRTAASLVPLSADGKYDQDIYNSLINWDPEVCVKQLLLIDMRIIEGNTLWYKFSRSITKNFVNIVFVDQSTVPSVRAERGKLFLEDCLKFLDRFNLERFMSKQHRDETRAMLEHSGGGWPDHSRHLDYNKSVYLGSHIESMLIGFKGILISPESDGPLGDKAELTEHYLRLARIAVEKFETEGLLDLSRPRKDNDEE